MSSTYPQIPYGWADFAAMRRERTLYVDKTRFLAAYLSCTDHFVFHTERELGGGYADICLAPHLQRYTGMRHGYVIELKYVTRGANAAQVAKAARDAAAQARRYVADERLARQYPSVSFTGLAVVFHGWELAHCDAVSRNSGESRLDSTNRA